MLRRCGVTNIAIGVRWDDLPSGSVAAAVGVISASTWARSRHLSERGPQPVRNAQWPWGLPWLTEGDRRQVEGSNDQLRNLLGVLHRARARSPAVHLSLWHPEDLGGARLGRPASPWQLREIRQWANREGLHRAAFFQCAYQRHRFPLPMAVLHSHPFRRRHIFAGWPQFRGRGNDCYIGPLPRACACSEPHESSPALKHAELRRADGGLLLEGSISRVTLPLMGIVGSESTLLRKGVKKGRLLHDRSGSRHGSSQASSTDSETTYLPEVSDFDEAADLTNPEDQMRIAWDLPTADIIDLNINHHLIAAAGFNQPIAEEDANARSIEARRGFGIYHWNCDRHRQSSTVTSWRMIKSATGDDDRPRLH